ncbi:glycosyltransferase [Pseudomonas putida]|uniref:glycosyltransferase n=1 Tax=Pseudomonas TaxID=286 RepID=UPI002ACCE9D4|nr:glycosyltransferase [Pseudomonas putida]
MRNILMLGFHVGEQYFKRYSEGDRFPQVAAYKLESRFIEALRSNGVTVSTLATLAVSTFPHVKRVWLPAASLPSVGGGQGKVMPVINLPVVKMLSRCLGVFYGLLRMGRQADAICVYAAHTPNLVAAYLYSRLFKKPYFIYIPDLPSYMDAAMGRGRLLKFLKRVDSALLSRLVQSARGLIVISRPMVEDNPAWKGIPYMVVEGISADPQPAVEVKAGDKKTILYAGGVNRAYGILELVEGFLRSGIDYELVICGRGDLEGYLKDVSARHPSVHYLGFVSPAEVERLQARASLLVITRDPAERYTRYSFPSKLIEYMSAGIPVLTTRLMGIPEPYFNYLNVIDGFSTEAVSESLVTISNSAEHSLFAKAAHGKVWVSETKTGRVVGQQVIEFMEKIK